MPSRAKQPSMNIALQKPWTAERFLAWAETQDGPFEFDGFKPVAMTGGNLGHSRITSNLNAALHARLRGTPCIPLGPDAGVETVNSAIRYPDALVTCSKFDASDRCVPNVVVIFEVLSPSSGRTDRIVKVREYAGIPSIRPYVILESTGIGATVLERASPDEVWRTSVLTGDDTLILPEIGIEIPMTDLYDGLDLTSTEA